METLYALLEFKDYLVIACIVAVFAGGAAFKTRQENSLRFLEGRLKNVQAKLDILLKHQGVELPPVPPSGLSPEVELLARDPRNKIAAIKLYREQNPGVSLAEAKAKIEAFQG